MSWRLCAIKLSWFISWSFWPPANCSSGKCFLFFVFFYIFAFTTLKKILGFFFATKLPTLVRKARVGGVWRSLCPTLFPRSGCDLWLIFFMFINLHIFPMFFLATFYPSCSVSQRFDWSIFSFRRELRAGPRSLLCAGGTDTNTAMTSTSKFNCLFVFFLLVFVGMLHQSQCGWVSKREQQTYKLFHQILAEWWGLKALFSCCPRHHCAWSNHAVSLLSMVVPSTLEACERLHRFLVYPFVHIKCPPTATFLWVFLSFLVLFSNKKNCE